MTALNIHTNITFSVWITKTAQATANVTTYAFGFVSIAFHLSYIKINDINIQKEFIGI